MVSFNGFVFNLMRNVRLTINFTGRQHRLPPFTLCGIIGKAKTLCVFLVVVGIIIVAATVGIETHPVLTAVSHGCIATGVIVGCILHWVS